MLLKREISWNEHSLSHLDSQTKQCEPEVQKIIHLQGLANQLPNAFTDPKSVTKSYIRAANAPIKIDVRVGQSNMANESQPRMKRGGPIGSKDKNPRVRKEAKSKDDPNEDMEIQKESHDIIDISVPEETDQVPEIHENKEISINYVTNGRQWNRREINVDDIFAYNIALNMINDNEDHEPMTIKDCKQSENWPKWKNAIEA